jgi:hypothetical protein
MTEMRQEICRILLRQIVPNSQIASIVHIPSLNANGTLES